MNLSAVYELATGWRADAATLRRRGAGAQADVLESVSVELEQRLDEWATQALSVSEAAVESNYSEDHLRELVRTGRLPDNRPPGSEGRITIRRCDLPRKPTAEQSSVENVVGEMLELMR